MTILDRYILKETVPPFIFSLFIFTFVLLISKILKLAELIINKGINFSIVIQLFFNILPSFLVISLPMAILLASLFGFGRLAEDSEIIAMQSIGVSHNHLLRPMISFSLVITFITFFVYIKILPKCNLTFKTLAINIVKLKATTGIKEGIFNDNFDNIIIYVNQISHDGNYLKDILISDSRNNKNPYLIIAKKGLLLTDTTSNKIILRLKEGNVHRCTREKPNDYFMLDFDTYDIALDVHKTLQNLQKAHKSEREMNLRELLTAIDTNKTHSLNYHPYQIEFHKKFSIPFACIIFAVLGPLLGMNLSKGGKLGAFAISIGIIFLYYLFITIGEALGDKGYLPALLAMWLPNIIFGIVTLFMIKKRSGNKVIKAY